MACANLLSVIMGVWRRWQGALAPSGYWECSLAVLIFLVFDNKMAMKLSK